MGPLAVLSERFPRIAAAIVEALLAFVAYDLLFTEPRLSLTVSDPREWLDLLLFLFVALAIGRLVALQRDRTAEADRRAREATSLFAISRILATSTTAAEAAPEVSRRLAADLGVRRVWISAGPPGRETTLTDTGPGEPVPSTTVSNTLVRAPGDEPAHWVRTHEPGKGRSTGAGDGQLLRVRMAADDEQTETIGSLWVVRDRGAGVPDRAETRILALAADQISLALRRDRLRTNASAAEVARQGESLKTALIDSVSHDLRTPLSSIRATAGGLADPDVPWSAPAAREAGRLIDEEAARLDRLVEGVLALSRIEARSVRTDLAAHDVRSLVDGAVARVLRSSGRGPQAIDIAVPDDLPLVVVDDVLIDVVLANVLDNAAVHGGPGATIEISATREPGDRVALEVGDSGPGVAADALPHIFDRFYRIDRPGVGPRRGLGIGLSIVRGLTEAMGGTAEARPSRLGGLAIVLHLPADDRAEGAPS